MKRKVLIVFPGIRIKKDEGAKHRLMSYIKEYDKAGFDVSVLAFCADVMFNCPDKYLNPIAKWLVYPFLLPLARNRFLSSLSIAYMRIIVAIYSRLGKYDVIQSELFGFKSFLCRNETIYITDVHGDTAYEAKESYRRPEWFFKYWLNVQKQFVESSDICIVVSENLKNQLEMNTNIPVKNYEIISCGVDIERFTKAPVATIEQLDLSNRIVLGYCGGLQAWQNFGQMVDLATKLNKLDNRVFLMVYSNGDVTPYQNKLEKLGRENYCFIGLPSAEVPKHLKLLDAGLLLRSNLVLNKVSSPTKICEYLAAGVPMICTQYSGDYERSIKDGVNGFIGKEPEFTDEEVKRLFDWLKNVKSNRSEVAKICVESVKNRTFEAEFSVLLKKIQSILAKDK